MMFPKKLQSALILALHVFSVQAVIGVEANKPSELPQLCQGDICEGFTKLAETELVRRQDKESDDYRKLEEQKDKIKDGICYGLAVFFVDNSIVTGSQEGFYSVLSSIKQYGENKSFLGEDNYNKAVKILKAQIDNRAKSGYKHIIGGEVQELSFNCYQADRNMMFKIIETLGLLPQDFGCLFSVLPNFYRKDAKSEIGHAVVFVKREQDLFFYDPNLRHTIKSNVEPGDKIVGEFVREVVDQIQTYLYPDEWTARLRLFQKASTIQANNIKAMLDPLDQLSNQLAQDRHREGQAGLKNWLGSISEYKQILDQLSDQLEQDRPLERQAAVKNRLFLILYNNQILQFKCMRGWDQCMREWDHYKKMNNAIKSKALQMSSDAVWNFYRAKSFLRNCEGELRALVREIYNAENNLILRVLRAEEKIKQIDFLITLPITMKQEFEMAKKFYREEQDADFRRFFNGENDRPKWEQLNQDQKHQLKLMVIDDATEQRKKIKEETELKRQEMVQDFETVLKTITAHEAEESAERFLLNYLVAQVFGDKYPKDPIFKFLSRKYEQRCYKKIAEQKKLNKGYGETYDVTWVEQCFDRFLEENPNNISLCEAMEKVKRRSTMFDPLQQLSNRWAQYRHREGLANLKNWLSSVLEYGSNSCAETTKDKEVKFNCMPDKKIIRNFCRAKIFVRDFEVELRDLVRGLYNAEKNTFLRVLLAEEGIKQIDSVIALLPTMKQDLKMAQKFYREEKAADLSTVLNMKKDDQSPMWEQLSRDQKRQYGLIMKDWPKELLENKIEKFTAHEAEESAERFLLNYLVAQFFSDRYPKDSIWKFLSGQHQKRCCEKIAEQKKLNNGHGETYDVTWVEQCFYRFLAQNTGKDFIEEIKKEKAYWLDVLLDLFGS